MVAAEPAPEPTPEPAPAAEPELTEAERYAIIYPRRAALIRRLGGLPEDCDFGPPDDALVQAVISSTSPKLRALDRSPTPA